MVSRKSTGMVRAQRGIRDDFAVLDDQMAGEARRQTVIVRDHDNGLPVFNQALEDFKDISAVTESRLPVGSSAMRMGGSLARARAIATRCC